ncbi:MAG: hypothetical protein ACJ749_15325 [Flavisolibacter sp.]
MPQSRKRHGHHEFHKPSAISSKQRTKGRVTVAVLFAVFGLVIGFFAASDNYIVIAVTTLIGAAIGYIIGKAMEQDASKKDS